MTFNIIALSVHWSLHNGFVATGGGDDSISLCGYHQVDGVGTLYKESQLAKAHDGDVNCVR